MWFRYLINALKTRPARAPAHPTPRQTAHPRRGAIRPRLEPLEDRSLLSNYAFIDLDTLGGIYSTAIDLNASGQVVGSMAPTVTDNEHAFLWNNGVITDLGTLGGPMSEAHGINDQGQVVGWASTAANFWHAFLVTPEDTDGNATPDLWYRDTDGNHINDLMLDLGTLGYGSGWSHDVNDSGQIAGNRVVEGLYSPFLWTPTIPNGSFPNDGTFTDLPEVPNGEWDYSYNSAYGINNAGDVVGTRVYGSNSEYSYESQVGLLWVDAELQNVIIRTPTGGFSPSHFGAINDVGQIVGYATNPDGFVHAILLTPISEPEVHIGDVQVAEGNTSMRAATFTVALSAASDQPVTVAYAAGNGTATAGSDFDSTSGTLTFAPGQTSKTITVLVNGDRLAEPNETFFVNLSSPTNATIADAQGVGTIVDDEPRISIGNVTKAEGRKGQTSAFTFTVTLSAAYDQAVTMSFRTANATATTGNGDYLAKSGTLTFAPGQTSKTITIDVKGDSQRESNETFYLDLSGNSGNSLFTKIRGIGTILNDD